MHKKEWIVRKNMGLLDFLVQYSGLPKKEIIHFIRTGCLYCNGEVCTNVKALVQTGDKLVLAHHSRPALPFEVLYEDQEIIVIDKPAGSLIHGGCQRKRKDGLSSCR